MTGSVVFVVFATAVVVVVVVDFGRISEVDAFVCLTSAIISSTRSFVALAGDASRPPSPNKLGYLPDAGFFGACGGCGG